MKSIQAKICWLTIFSIAMGYLESAVVVYLRKLYYPDGFDFPLNPIEPQIALVEFLREAATIIMLASIGILSGKTSTQRFAFFVYCFAVWDIFYYVFLKVILDWPASLFTWDILFLIPVPWVGPVIAPCIVSLTMIVLMLMVIYCSEKNIPVMINFKEWLLLIGGSFVVVISFVWDYISYVNNSGYSFWSIFDEKALFSEVATYVPQEFNWLLFSLGELLIVAGILFIFLRLNKTKKFN